MVSSQSAIKNAASQKSDAGVASPVLVHLVEMISNMPYDRQSIPQAALDLANKYRSSLFPWRGQFSPEFIEILLNTYSQKDDIIFDPFVGSGTTLFESLRKGLRSYGAEINPSAVTMAKTAELASLSSEERKQAIQEALCLVKKHFRSATWDLFSCLESDQCDPHIIEASTENRLKDMLQETECRPIVRTILANAIIRYMDNGKQPAETDLFRALEELARIVENIPFSERQCNVFHADARCIPLPASSTNLIITSPPYINVFNYHQNHRPAMELFGWDVLAVAKSEIGSNRKHRQNRFLTVIQYALDMLDALKEMYRILTPHGRAIIVVGRESSVRGARFKNGMLVALLASGGAGFHLEMLQERKFMNKFGEIIFEDILHLIPCENAILADDSFARLVASWFLQQASCLSDGQVRDEILEAIERSQVVQKSPVFNIQQMKAQ
jgi:SAM-dependent methyltransferase